MFPPCGTTKVSAPPHRAAAYLIFWPSNIASAISALALNIPGLHQQTWKTPICRHFVKLVLLNSNRARRAVVVRASRHMCLAGADFLVRSRVVVHGPVDGRRRGRRRATDSAGRNEAGSSHPYP